MDSSESTLKPSPSSNPIPDVEPSSNRVRAWFPPGETFVMSMGFPCQDLSVAGRKQGLSGSQSSLALNLIGLLPRTQAIGGVPGCPNCGSGCGHLGIPVCQFQCEPQTLAPATRGTERLSLPTPTASSYGSCRGGGAGRVGKWRMSLHSRGILHPEDWERMMDFPIGHTAAMPSATPSVRRSRNSSPAASPPSPNSEGVV